MKFGVSCHKWCQKNLYSHLFRVWLLYFMFNIICHIYKISCCMFTSYSYWVSIVAYFMYKFYVSSSHYLLHLWSLVFHVPNSVKNFHFYNHVMFAIYILCITSSITCVKYHVACLRNNHIWCRNGKTSGARRVGTCRPRPAQIVSQMSEAEFVLIFSHTGDVKPSTSQAQVFYLGFSYPNKWL